MPPTLYQADLPLIKEVLHNWLKKSISEKAIEWLEQKRSLIESDALIRNFFLAFGTVPRFVGRDALKLDKQDLKQADQLRKGWPPPPGPQIRRHVFYYYYHSLARINSSTKECSASYSAQQKWESKLRYF